MARIMFNICEVLEAAKHIEQLGRAYYEAAAALIPGGPEQDLLLDLAAMEATHEHIFDEMQRGLSSEERECPIGGPEKEGLKSLLDLADATLFVSKEHARAVLDGKDVRAIAEFAIEREKETIVFLQGLKMAIPVQYGAAKLDGILREEMEHVMMLTRYRERSRAN
jgi:rubrerythrin